MKSTILCNEHGVNIMDRIKSGKTSVFMSDELELAKARAATIRSYVYDVFTEVKKMAFGIFRICRTKVINYKSNEMKFLMIFLLALVIVLLLLSVRAIYMYAKQVFNLK